MAILLRKALSDESTGVGRFKVLAARSAHWQLWRASVSSPPNGYQKHYPTNTSHATIRATLESWTECHPMNSPDALIVWDSNEEPQNCWKTFYRKVSSGNLALIWVILMCQSGACNGSLSTVNLPVKPVGVNSKRRTRHAARRRWLALKLRAKKRRT